MTKPHAGWLARCPLPSRPFLPVVRFTNASFPGSSDEEAFGAPERQPPMPWHERAEKCGMPTKKLMHEPSFPNNGKWATAVH